MSEWLFNYIPIGEKPFSKGAGGPLRAVGSDSNRIGSLVRLRFSFLLSFLASCSPDSASLQPDITNRPLCPWAVCERDKQILTGLTISKANPWGRWGSRIGEAGRRFSWQRYAPSCRQWWGRCPLFSARCCFQSTFEGLALQKYDKIWVLRIIIIIINNKIALLL